MRLVAEVARTRRRERVGWLEAWLRVRARRVWWLAKHDR